MPTGDAQCSGGPPVPDPNSNNLLFTGHSGRRFDNEIQDPTVTLN